ncbi:MAG TPA: glycerophosphodiester phosphodiesterase family protein [Xanthobacteraceae bacterium]
MAGLDWLTARPIAHRALHGGALVENTLSAAAAAVAANYGIETDLQLSADGEVIVFHDDMFDRLTTATGSVKAKTLAEIKKIAFKVSGERIPTLGELLALVAGRTPLVLELKSAWDGDDRLVTRVATELLSYAGPVAAMSFDPRMVEALRKHAPGLPRGIVAERYYRAEYWNKMPWRHKFALGNLLHFLSTRPHFVAYRVQDLPSIAPLLARHALGMPLLTWTVRTEAECRRARLWANQMIFEGFRP